MAVSPTTQPYRGLVSISHQRLGAGNTTAFPFGSSRSSGFNRAFLHLIIQQDLYAFVWAPYRKPTGLDIFRTFVADHGTVQERTRTIIISNSMYDMTAVFSQPRAINFQDLSARFQKSSDISAIPSRCAYPHLRVISITTTCASSQCGAGLLPRRMHS